LDYSNSTVCNDFLQLREKEKKLIAVERECVRLREHMGTSAPGLARQIPLGRDKRSLFRTLGSKKDINLNSSDHLRDSHNRASVVMSASLAQKSADTAQFLRASAQRMTRGKFWSSTDEEEEDRHSTGDTAETGGRLSLLQGVGVASAEAMTTLKERLTAVKGKYYGDEVAPGSRSGSEVLGPVPSSQSFNLEAMPDEPLPPGWEARLSRSKGKVYYCNPVLKLTQWDRPTVDSLKAKKQASLDAQKAKRCVVSLFHVRDSPNL
jgi:myosin-5